MNDNDQIIRFEEGCAESFQKELRQKFYEFQRENPKVQSDTSEFQFV